VGSWQSFMFTVKAAADETLISLQTALFTGTALLLLALSLVWARGYASESSKQSSLMVMLLLIAVPGTLWGIGLIYFFNQPNMLGDVYRSLIIVSLMQGLYALPFVFLYLRQRFDSWSPRLFDVARLHGLSAWDRLKHIEFPLRGAVLAQVWVLGTLLCFTEVAGSLLVVPPGGSTLPIRFFTLVHYGQESMIASYALLMVCLTLALASLPMLFFRRGASLS
jgi:iron(III) transport system permease protein